MTPALTAVKATPTDRPQDGYMAFLAALETQAKTLTGPLFTTAPTDDLYDLFLACLPEEARPHYKCNACRRFIETYGGLVQIDMLTGETAPALWSFEAPEFFRSAVASLQMSVRKRPVTGVFITQEQVLGQPITGPWHHMAVVLPAALLTPSPHKNASQIAAEKLEDYKMLHAALYDYPLDLVAQAVAILEAESLYRGEKTLGVAKWLEGVHTRRNEFKQQTRRANLVWHAVATAPTGFCHVRSTMIGTLLDDLKEDLPFAEVSRRFAAKMNPLQYQRPQAAPARGNIAQAEKVIEQLGAAGSLKRRYARVEEIQAIWKPRPVEQPASNGVFGHLKPKDDATPEHATIELPEVKMTWDKFLKTVLPNAWAIKYYVPHSRQNYGALVTAVDMDAPPLFQWDTPAHRNPFSWYVYHSGSTPASWRLTWGWCPVTAICYQPSMWQDGFAQHGKSVFFILAGAKDENYKSCSNGLFPELLKSDYHSIRATIEAYSQSARLEGFEEATACGLRLQAGQAWDASFLVTGPVTAQYTLDRWD